MGHHPAIGKSGRIDAPPVEGIFSQSGDQRAHKADVVDIVDDRVGAASAGIPRQQPFAEAAAAVWIDGDKVSRSASRSISEYSCSLAP